MGRRSNKARVEERARQKAEAKMAEIRAAWERVPDVNCKGLCSDSCGPIDMSDVERAAISERGFEIPGLAAGCWRCPALDFAGRCMVYDIRPMICRLYGVTESLKCKHGCVPDGGFISDELGFTLLGEAMRIGGDALITTTEDVARVVRTLDTPEGRRTLQEMTGRAPDLSHRLTL